VVRPWTPAARASAASTAAITLTWYRPEAGRRRGVTGSSSRL